MTGLGSGRWPWLHPRRAQPGRCALAFLPSTARRPQALQPINHAGRPVGAAGRGGHVHGVWCPAGSNGPSPRVGRGGRPRAGPAPGMVSLSQRPRSPTAIRVRSLGLRQTGSVRETAVKRRAGLWYGIAAQRAARRARSWRFAGNLAQLPDSSRGGTSPSLIVTPPFC